LKMNHSDRTGDVTRGERAVLVKLITPKNADKIDARNPLGELAALTEAAGGEVVAGLIQRRMTPASRTYIGKGKVAELTELTEAHEADLVVFDDDLSPAQIRSLEGATNRRVIDRSELILDIFAARAQTHEARLQVEIAQLEYTAPRLRGMWTHLERIAGAGGGSGAGVVGGIGTRGPGERQVEIDRRIVKDRLSFLRREINRIDDRKRRIVQSRHNEYTVSLVGYTNAGKSTLLNTLTGAGRDARDMLFATLDTKTVRWEFSGGRHALLSDTVGFVRDLPHRLIASFKATLEETLHADLLFHVVDVSAKDAMRQIKVVQQVLEELGCGDKPVLTLLNKIDVETDAALTDLLLGQLEPAIAVSARTGRGLERVVEYVLAKMQPRAVDATLQLSAGDGKLLTLIGQYALVHDQRYEGSGVELDVTIDRTQLEQLRGRHPQLVVVRESGPSGGDLRR